MRGYRSEAPYILQEGEGPTYDLAKRVADWIEADERRTSKSGWVVGIYGGRGTGKTSFLLTLMSILYQRDRPLRAGAAQPKCELPKVEEERLMDALFAPAATRDDDDLLFLLLHHLERFYKIEEKELYEARQAEVERRDKRLFIEYERDISTSSEALPRRFVELHSKVARTTTALREQLTKILKSATHQQKSTFPIFVDDLDLRPERALEMLEIVHLFFNRPGVVVVLTADKDLLIHAIDHALEKQRMKRPGLAGALLAKYVPYEWMLPVPDDDGRLAELWPVQAPPPDKREPALPGWWPEGAAKLLNDPPLPIREKARTLLGPLLPRTYRGLAAMHNRLLALEDSWAVHAGSSEFTEVLRARFSTSLGLLPELVPIFISLVVALDVRYPELGLLEIMHQEPLKLVEALQHLLPRRPSEQLDRGAGELPLLDRLREPYLEGRHLGEAKRLLRRLAQQWDGLATLSRKAKPRSFLAVSLNSHALEASVELWEEQFQEEQIVHLDLLGHASTGRASAEELRAARRAARKEIEARGVRSLAGEVMVFARAQLPLLIWLGWELRYLRTITAINFLPQTRDGRRFEPFEGPAGILAPRETGSFEVLRLSHDVEPEHSVPEAVVIVDLIDKSTPDQLHRFQDKSGAELPCRDGYRLVRKAREAIRPADVVPILRDVLELLRQLRERGVRHIHLAFAGPDVMAFFLGQQLNAQGVRLSLYELYADRYAYVFDLEDDPSDA